MSIRETLSAIEPGNRKKLVLLVVAAFTAIALWVAINFANTGSIEITASGARGTVSVEVLPSGDSKPSKLTLESGETKKMRVKKGSYRIDSSAGAIKSVDVIVVAGMHTSKISVPRGEQRAISKLGSDAQYCPMVVDDHVYSYNCYGEGGVFRHSVLTRAELSPLKPVLNSQMFVSLAQTKDGLVGVSSGPGLSYELVYVNLQMETVSKITAQSLYNKPLSNPPDIIASPTESRFIVTIRDRDAAYLFDGADDSDPVKLLLPQNAKLSDNIGVTSFSFYKDKVICYGGVTGSRDGAAGDRGADSTASGNDYIYEFDAKGSLTSTIKLPKRLAATRVDKISDSLYAATDDEGLNLYYRQNDKMIKVYTITDGFQALTLGDKTYVAANEGIYSLTLGDRGSFSLSNMFNSPAIRVAGLYTNTKGELIFTGVTKRTKEAPTDIYKVLNDTQTKSPLEEQDLTSKLSRYITGYDYDNKTIVFYLGASGGSQGPSYKDLLASFKKKLNELGIDVGGRDVELGALN